MKEDIQERIQIILAHHNLTQKQFCKYTKIKEALLTDILKKRSNPGFNTLYKIYRAFNVNLHWLVTGQGKDSSRDGWKINPIAHDFDGGPETSVGDRLERLISIMEITQKQLMADTGIRLASLAGILRGKSKPNLDTLLRLFVRYNVNLHWIITGEGPEFYEDNIINLMVESKNDKPDPEDDLIDIDPLILGEIIDILKRIPIEKQEAILQLIKAQISLMK